MELYYIILIFDISYNIMWLVCMDIYNRVIVGYIII